MNRKILHLFADGDKIELPYISSLESVAVVYVHVEFEKQTKKDYVKLCANFITNYNNHQGIICAFHQPPRGKDAVHVPQFRQHYDVNEKQDLVVKVVANEENKIKKCYVQLEYEQRFPP